MGEVPLKDWCVGETNGGKVIHSLVSMVQPHSQATGLEQGTGPTVMLLYNVVNIAFGLSVVC